MQKYTLISNCRICGSTKLIEVLDLGLQPWCNDFVYESQLKKVKSYPLAIIFCQDCSAIQINCTVPKKIMYENHPYVSGTTATMAKHFDSVTKYVIKNYLPNKNGLVVDIGSNDGTLLKAYKSKGFKVLGVDPCKRVAKLAIRVDINTVVDYFDDKLAQKIRSDYGKAFVISAANVFYHIENIHKVAEGIRSLLVPEGVLVVQGSYLPEIIKKNIFDIFYHEHQLVYRGETLNHFLKLHGLEIFDIKIYPKIHGGSFVAFIGHQGRRRRNFSVDKLFTYEKDRGYHKLETYKKFALNVQNIKSQISKLLITINESGKFIVAFGAPAKGTVLLNYCNLDNKLVKFAVEKNPFKFGRYIPGTNIKIIDEKKVENSNYYLLLAWNFSKEIFSRFNRKTNFIVPFPKPKIIINDNK